MGECLKMKKLPGKMLSLFSNNFLLLNLEGKVGLKGRRKCYIWTFQRKKRNKVVKLV